MDADHAARTGAIRWVAPLLLVVAAGAVRLAGLGLPETIYFDETYYVADAAALLERGVEDGFAVHPPVGKWLIAAGLAALGEGPYGWRVSSALAGTATVLFTYLAALRLLRHRGAAAVAGLVVAFDGLAVVMSRIAMLDVFVALFIVIAFWLLLVERDLQWRGVPDAPPGDRDDSPALPLRPHWPRWLAGLFLALAVATKWSAVLAIGAAGLFVLGSELAFRRRATGRVLAEWPRLAANVALVLVLLPAAVYVVSYAGWFANYERTRPGAERCPDPDEPCGVALPTRVGDWWGEQREIARFHLRLTADHPYQATALTWPTLARPMAYYYESCPASPSSDESCVVTPGHVSHILAMGNPAVFWLALPAYPLLFWAGFVRRDWRALAVTAFLLGQYVPWLIAARPVFFFYATPLVPFIALTLAYAARRALDWPHLRWVPTALAAVVLAAFLFWFPLFSGAEIDQDAWNQRIWTTRWV